MIQASMTFERGDVLYLDGKVLVMYLCTHDAGASWILRAIDPLRPMRQFKKPNPSSSR